MCDTPSPYSTPHVFYICCTHINLLDRWFSWYYLSLDIERKWMKYQLDQPSKQEFLFPSLVPIFTWHSNGEGVTQREWSFLFCWMNDKSPLGILCAQLHVFTLFLVPIQFVLKISPRNTQKACCCWSPWDMRNGTRGKATTPNGVRDLIEKNRIPQFCWGKRHSRHKLSATKWCIIISNTIKRQHTLRHPKREEKTDDKLTMDGFIFMACIVIIYSCLAIE